MTKTTVEFVSSFEKDTFKGLTSNPKYLLSRYIYDKKGDKLFQDIMDLPEYYLTNCEYDIIQDNTSEITSEFNISDKGFDLIELGAGDGKKTRIFLHHLADKGYDFSYIPIDISVNAIKNLVHNLSEEIPGLDVQGEEGEYFEVLERLKNFKTRKKVILVLGSNIGNLLHPRAIEFLSRLNHSMNDGDMVFMGFDQKKHPQTILDAYNDKTGVTEAFNKNHLYRINKELEGNFMPDNFLHWEVYDPETGTAKSFLVATEAQKISIKKLGLDFELKQWETIHTEISQKYDDEVVNYLAEKAGLKIQSSFTDSKKYYKNYIFTKTE